MLVKEKLNRYQKGITLHTKSREVRCLCGFPALCLLLKLGKSKDILKYICLIFVPFYRYFISVAYICELPKINPLKAETHSN